MRHLSIADYDARERDARISATYPALRSFSAAAFAQVNFPMRVEDERELIRYADMLQETLSRKEHLEERTYSEAEAEAIKKVSEQIRAVTTKFYGRTVQPLMCLFPPLPILRAVEAIAKARGRRLRIFEIGPGSGYLGAYLINAGHSYGSMDIVQALYLWQNRLFGSIAEDSQEWVLDEGVMAKCVHVPWWQFAHYHERLPITADVVICDAALGEMETLGLFYNLLVARAMIDGSDCAAFMFQHPGEERVNTMMTIEYRLGLSGLIGRRIGGVSMYSLPGRLDDVFAPDATDLPPVGPAGGRRYAPKSFLSFQESELLESYGFFKYLGLGF
jgi:hypothetical protein